MTQILITFLKRIPREGFRSMTVPILALVLVVLISLMQGAKIRMIEELDDVIDNFPVRAEISDPISSEVNGLFIGMNYIEIFTNVDANRSVAQYLKEVMLSRQLSIEEHRNGFAGEWLGITFMEADARLSPLTGAYVDFFEGYDEAIFQTLQAVAIVPSHIFDRLETNPSDANRPTIILSLEHIEIEITEDEETIFTVHETEVELEVVGIIYHAGSIILSPFWTVNAAARELTLPQFSSQMSATINDNSLIPDFAEAASAVFARPGDVNTRMSFSLTIFDAIYNNVIRTLRQNIRLIDAATPFVYAVSILIGFIASYLLTRRRKPEFAVMRSIGVNKRDVFWGALGEQAFLCLPGVIMGFVIFSAYFGQLLWVPPVMFFFCYLLGSIFAASQAAGTNVLKILRENIE